MRADWVKLRFVREPVAHHVASGLHKCELSAGKCLSRFAGKNTNEVREEHPRPASGPDTPKPRAREGFKLDEWREPRDSHRFAIRRYFLRVDCALPSRSREKRDRGSREGNARAFGAFYSWLHCRPADRSRDRTRRGLLAEGNYDRGSRVISRRSRRTRFASHGLSRSVAIAVIKRHCVASLSCEWLRRCRTSSVVFRISRAQCVL